MEQQDVQELLRLQLQFMCHQQRHLLRMLTNVVQQFLQLLWLIQMVIQRLFSNGMQMIRLLQLYKQVRQLLILQV